MSGIFRPPPFQPYRFLPSRVGQQWLPTDRPVVTRSVAMGFELKMAVFGTTPSQKNATLVNGVPVSILEGSLSVDHRIEERSTSRFIIVDRTASARYQKGQRIFVTDGSGVPYFAGYMHRAVERRPADGTLLHEILCIDNHYKADKRRAAKTYTNQTAGAIVRDLITTYLEPEGIMLNDALVEDGPTLGEVVISYARVSEAIARLAELADFVFRIDEANILYFQPRTMELYPTVLDGPRFRHKTVRVANASELYRNKQYIRGVRAITDPQTVTRKGDGATRAFVMDYAVAKVPSSVKVNAASKTIGIRGLDTGKDFYWSKGEIQITQDEAGTILTSADTLELTYQGEVELIVLSQDDAAIEERKTVEGGGTGIVEAVDDEPYHTTTNSALESAAAKLAKYGRVGRVFTGTYKGRDLREGMLATFNFPEHGLSSAQLLVESASIIRRRRAPATPGASEFYYETRIVAVEFASIGSPEKFFARAFERPSFIDRLSIGQGVFLTVPMTVSETLEQSEVVDWDVIACPVPSPTLFPSASLFPC